MGNVHASASMPAPPPIETTELKSPSEQPEAVAPKSRNPGTIEDLHKKCKDVFPNPFEGVRLAMNKGLSNHFQISHTLTMSNLMPSGYKFGATYVGTNIVGPGEAYPIFLGEIDPSGNLNANIIHQFRKNLKSKLTAQFQDSKCQVFQTTTDFKSERFTVSGTLANIDLVHDSGIIVGQYLHNVTKNIDLGAEVALHYNPKLPGGSATAVQLSGRYTDPKYVFAATLNAMEGHLTYYRQVNENVHFGVELEANLKMGESLATFGYQVEAPKSDLSFRASIDSNLTVVASMEKRLHPLPAALQLTGHMDHLSKQPGFRLGCGVSFG